LIDAADAHETTSHPICVSSSSSWYLGSLFSSEEEMKAFFAFACSFVDSGTTQYNIFGENIIFPFFLSYTLTRYSLALSVLIHLVSI